MFKEGDRVRNVNPDSRYYAELAGRVGTFVGMLPWTGVPACCDVIYPGMTDLYGCEKLAQRVSDLEKVEEANQ